MELRQLEYFVAVADEANFTRAAERIHVVQPAVSAQIARLERELGQLLVDRTRRQIRLTAAGEAMLPFARAALQAVSDARRAVQELTDLVYGTVTLGTVTSHNVDTPALLADFHADHPNVEITLCTDTSDALIDGVRSGRLDAAVVSIGSDERPDGLDIEIVTDEAIDAAVASDDGWADRPSVTLEELGQRPLIALPVGSGIRHQLDSAFAAAGIRARVAFEATTPQALADLAERGLGVAIVPSSVARNRTGLHPLPIVPELRGRLVLAWRSAGPISPAARVLVEKARRLLRVGADA
ncbi:LysR family transcriptional regulator [Mycolicibacterium komossense]|uniref:LysR family transcriptional regulator n=1 Tax=Mycolicibacterium komossense TaxID=1779 RepID=A0ABT3CB36_9MYCO|nr:LysR family transcriptional regulator [Mycolicibacterium komossense]MCV7226689.1 LysR family transcriptional regulator [Mycolicibacterium komossense]